MMAQDFFVFFLVGVGGGRGGGEYFKFTLLLPFAMKGGSSFCPLKVQTLSV